jgi:hypothetical protein
LIRGGFFMFWASRFGTSCLASGYPLHHPPPLRVVGWFRCYPSRFLTIV